MTFKAAKAKAISKSDLFGSVVDLAKYTEDEFAQIASALQGDDPFTINYKVPTRPRTGTLVYADGTHWNPGAGEGFYQYTSGGVWEPLSALEIGGVFAKAFTLNAASGITNVGNDIQLEKASASQFGAVKVDGTTITAAAGVISATPPTEIHASLGADVLLNNIANYFDGPSIAQGTTGTWWVSGTVTLVDTVGVANFLCKLWDGTTVIASAKATSAGTNFVMSVALSGWISAPAGNLRISVKDINSTSGKIQFNITGESKDSTISAFRIA